MFAQLTLHERRLAVWILGALALCGLFVAVAGRHDLIAVHGMVIVCFAALLLFVTLAPPQGGSSGR